MLQLEKITLEEDVIFTQVLGWWNYNWQFFELFCIKNDFAKCFAKCCNFIKYFASHITVILENVILLYYRKNQISLCDMILWNAFLTS